MLTTREDPVLTAKEELVLITREEPMLNTVQRRANMDYEREVGVHY